MATALIVKVIWSSSEGAGRATGSIGWVDGSLIPPPQCLSTRNNRRYRAITKTSRAIAVRDPAKLAGMGLKDQM